MSMLLDTHEVHDLADDLHAAGRRVVPDIERLVDATGHQVVAAAQVLVPVDTAYLRSTISVDVRGMSFEAGPTAEYGGYVEEGTSEMAPEPYMGPAFDRNLPGFEDRLGQLGARAVLR